MSDPIPKKRGNPNMVAGGKSLNPNGRPRLGESLAEAFRGQCSPERIVELVVRLAESATSEQVRLAAIHFIADRAHGKSRESVDLQVDGQVIDARMIALVEAARMTPHERRKLLDGPEPDDELDES